MRVTAAVAPAPDHPLRLEELRLDGPGPGEVLVRIVASGVCRTDADARSGRSAFPLPGVLGHEGVGRVLDVGPGVRSPAVGEAVLLGWPACGRCRHCRGGRPRYCADLPGLLFGGRRPDGGAVFRRADGTPVAGRFFGQSSFASHAVLPAEALVPVRTSLPLAAVAALGCGISAGAGAVLYAARPEPGASVAVFGVGAVGLAAVMAARCTAATTIVAVDRDPARLALARRYGATHTVDVTGVRNVARAVREHCDGPADVTVECTGDPRVVRQAVDAVGMPGTCCLVGAARPGETFAVDQQTMLRGKRIQGSLGGEGRPEELVPALLRLAEQGRFPFPELVAYRSFDDPEAALADLLAGAVVKPVLVLEPAALTARTDGCEGSGRSR
ncbi:NAD(P)-dependent alcohol dehydrogenase [Micromonospora echinaurantiaca]|uniref:NAD(P)-dependent alcohol dehydrogenase n=1 Tax=Micromonospora echinaurantiaca TaxID=47857 RepID=UPI0037AC42BC